MTDRSSSNPVGASPAKARDEEVVVEREERTEVLPEQSDATVATTEVVEPREELYRPEGGLRTPETETETSTVEETVVAPAVRDRATERAERKKALGVVDRTTTTQTTTASPVENVVAVVKPKRTTDKWHGALPFFLLRLITAALLGWRGFQHLRMLGDTRSFLEHSILPQGQINLFAIGLGVLELVIAFLLLVGFGARVAGLALAVLMGALLALFVYGKVNPLSHPGTPEGQVPNILTYGMRGETELLLLGLGLLFFLLGAGGWAIDAGLRRSRARQRAARDEAELD